MMTMASEDWIFLAFCPVVIAWYGFVCACFMYIDLRGMPFGLPKLRRLQPKPPPTFDQYMSMLRSDQMAINGFLTTVVTPPLVLMYYKWMAVTVTAPPFAQTLLETLALAVLWDCYFYTGHRLLHLPKLYHLHKLHHSWKAPCAFEGGYFGAVDLMLVNFGPLIFLPPLVTRHYYSLLFIGIVGTAHVAITHSGYDCRLALNLPDISHDAHHEFFNVNFSTFGYIDKLFGTYLSEEGAIEKRKALGGSKQTSHEHDS